MVNISSGFPWQLRSKVDQRRSSLIFVSAWAGSTSRVRTLKGLFIGKKLDPSKDHLVIVPMVLLPLHRLRTPKVLSWEEDVCSCLVERDSVRQAKEITARESGSEASGINLAAYTYPLGY